jgi:hypothetical protein
MTIIVPYKNNLKYFGDYAGHKKMATDVRQDRIRRINPDWRNRMRSPASGDTPRGQAVIVLKSFFISG